MKTINYKGFTLDVEMHGNKLKINEVEASITNQIALLTEFLWNSFQDSNRVSMFTVELDYKIVDRFNNYGCDYAIDIDKWLIINPSMQQKVLIELLMLEDEEIKEQLQELV